jgi:hypothetical protein
MNRFDKPFRILPTVDERKGLELFNIVSNLDTHELLQYSLMNQIPLDFANNNGECLIHEVINIDSRKASEHSKLSVIKFLVQQGVNPNKPNNSNQTPLHLASKFQLANIAEYLLEIGVDPNYQDNLGNTPMHYLLTGLIKPVDSSTDVMDFVPPPKKVKTKTTEEIIKIKQLIWKCIMSVKDLPILATIKNTIDGLLEEDDSIVTRQIDTMGKISKLATSTTSTDNTSEIIEMINQTKQTIQRQITRLFNSDRNLDEFAIHKKESDSWSPVSGGDVALIKNGKVKKTIVKEMKRLTQEIKTDIDNFNVNTDKSQTIYDYYGNFVNRVIDKYNGTIEPMGHVNPYYKYYKNKNIQQVGGNHISILFESGDFDEINDTFRHPLAIDNASDIIDFENLTYVGGPRKLAINPIDLVVDMTYIVNNDNHYNKILLYILFKIIDKCDANNFNNQIIDHLELNDNNIARLLETEYDNIKLPPALPPPPVAPAALAADIKYNNYLFSLILAYTAIIFPSKFDDIQNIGTPAPAAAGAGVPAAAGAPQLRYNNNSFAKKWFNLYSKQPIKNNAFVARWLYSMMCDLVCRESNNNLEGTLNVNFIILIAGLYNSGNDKKQSLINAYKPQLLSYIMRERNFKMKFAKIIMWMMDFNVNNNDFINFYLRDIDNIEQISGLRTSTELKNLGKLVFYWCQYLFTYARKTDPGVANNIQFKILNADVKEYYDGFKKANEQSDEVICKIILQMNDKSDNKLLKQNILDLIFKIKSLNVNNGAQLQESIKQFNQISYIHLFAPVPAAPAPPIPYQNAINILDDMKENQMPSKYGLYNYSFDKDKNISSGHLYISHILGLYYQGTLLSTKFNIMTDTFDISHGGQQQKLAITFNNVQHSFNNEKLGENQLPLPLNYLIVNPAGGAVAQFTDQIKCDYYNVNGRDIIIPTSSEYERFLIEKIKQYQNIIIGIIKNPNSIKTIISDLLGGNSKKLGNIYTKLYPQLVSITNIMQHFINTYNRASISITFNTFNFTELANKLNKINSNYYLYYYLYQPEKLIKLSRFNFYQIPTREPSKYFYYDDADAGVGTELANIFTEEQPAGPVAGPADESDKHLLKKNKLLKMANRGFVNNFNIGDYTSILEDYDKVKLPIKNTIENNEFKILKESKMPPSLYASLNDFYKYAIIEFVEKILEYIKNNVTAVVPPVAVVPPAPVPPGAPGPAVVPPAPVPPGAPGPAVVPPAPVPPGAPGPAVVPPGPETLCGKDIYDSSESLIKSTGISIKDHILSVYDFIVKLIQELVKEQINIYINNAIYDKYKEFFKTTPAAAAGAVLGPDTLSILLPIKEIKINFTDIKLDNIINRDNTTNLFSIIVKPEKQDNEPFMIYPNDFSNINRLKKKYGIVVDKGFITKLMKKSGSIYIPNLDGYNPIYPIVKNYNYGIIELLKKDKIIDFRFENSPIDYIRKECLNNIDKILNNVSIADDKTKIKNILSNIDGYLYCDVKSMIMANDTFGKNNLLYLEESFNMCSYLTLQYLSEKFDVAELNNIGINFTELNKNYLGENLRSFNIYNNKESIIISQMIKQIEIDLEKPNVNSTDLEAKKVTLERLFGAKTYLNDNHNLNDPLDIIQSYVNYNRNNNDILLYINAWYKLLKSNLTHNYNLVPLYVLQK